MVTSYGIFHFYTIYCSFNMFYILGAVHQVQFIEDYLLRDALTSVMYVVEKKQMYSVMYVLEKKRMY